MPINIWMKYKLWYIHKLECYSSISNAAQHREAQEAPHSRELYSSNVSSVKVKRKWKKSVTKKVTKSDKWKKSNTKYHKLYDSIHMEF